MRPKSFKAGNDIIFASKAVACPICGGGWDGWNGYCARCAEKLARASAGEYRELRVATLRCSAGGCRRFLKQYERDRKYKLCGKCRKAAQTRVNGKKRDRKAEKARRERDNALDLAARHKRIAKLKCAYSRA
jgi:hypothetical protein